jgi:hypothetical protein
MTRLPLTRRDFLKIVALSAGTLAFRPFIWQGFPELQQSELLGRITVGKVDVYARPDANSQIVGALYEDQVIPWIREVIGAMPGRDQSTLGRDSLWLCVGRKPATCSQPAEFASVHPAKHKSESWHVGRSHGPLCGLDSR